MFQTWHLKKKPNPRNSEVSKKAKSEDVNNVIVENDFRQFSLERQVNVY